MSPRILRFAQGARFRFAGPVPATRIFQFPTRFSRSASSSGGPSPGAAPADKKTSPHVNYYKVYGRSFVKVLLMSLLVYQGIYYGWMKLEQLEVKKTKGDEIQELEDKIRELQRRAEKLEIARDKRLGKI